MQPGRLQQAHHHGSTHFRDLARHRNAVAWVGVGDYVSQGIRSTTSSLIGQSWNSWDNSLKHRHLAARRYQFLAYSISLINSIK